MNPNENKISTDAEINASLRVSLLALFGGAAVWLIVLVYVLRLAAGLRGLSRETDELKRLNRLKRNTIFVGQVLKVNGGSKG